MFFLVSGAAASGKSTLAKNAPARLQNIDCHDYDEKVCADAQTRCQQLEEWVQLALECQQQGRDFLLTSCSPLGELLACPSAPKLDGIAACLLDCGDTVRITRMRDRGIDPDWPPTQHVLSWAAWHRMHAWDPRWEPQVVTGNGPETHSYGRWKNWEQHDRRWQVAVIDTTANSAGQTMDAVVSWVENQKKKPSPLTPETKWWE
jgi:hypothetical protein